MYRQETLYPGVDEDETLHAVDKYLAQYEKDRQHVFMLEPHLQSPQLSADKVQTSAHNSSEDDLIRYLDAKGQIADCERAIMMLYHLNRPLMKMRYMDDFGAKSDIEVAKLMKLTTLSNVGIIVASATYNRYKREDRLAFAEFFQGSRLQIHYKISK